VRVAHRWARGHDPTLAGRLSAALHLSRPGGAQPALRRLARSRGRPRGRRG
jgi:hypothetical protein